jgi:hypothetical protein
MWLEKITDKGIGWYFVNHGWYFARLPQAFIHLQQELQ